MKNKNTDTHLFLQKISDQIVIGLEEELPFKNRLVQEPEDKSLIMQPRDPFEENSNAIIIEGNLLLEDQREEDIVFTMTNFLTERTFSFLSWKIVENYFMMAPPISGPFHIYVRRTDSGIMLITSLMKDFSTGQKGLKCIMHLGLTNVPITSTQ